MKRGFFRLWVFLSALWMTGCVATLSFRIFAEPACYALATVSFSNPIPEKNREIVEHIKQNLVDKTICGDTTPSLLLTLEQFAKEGIATQVSYQR
jgi:hypothetical protein